MEALGVSPTAPERAKSLRGPKACSTCARAKSRCIPGPVGQDKCERCHRLAKPCFSQTPAPPRKRKTPKPTRVAELERRLEDLTARIASVQRLGATDLDQQQSQQHASRFSSGSPGLSVVGDHDEPLDPQAFPDTQAPVATFGGPSWEQPMSHLFPTGSFFESDVVQADPQHAGGHTEQLQRSMPYQEPTGTPMPVDLTQIPDYHRSSSSQNAHQQEHRQPNPPWPEGDEAESMLQTYRQRMEHLFPFVVIPRRLSSDQLREQRPFLWKAIMVEACLFDGPRQDALGKELLREVSQAALIQPQKTLDLLQGLQMLIAWYHYNLDNFQMANLLFLARSITSTICSDESYFEPGPDGAYRPESLERMRALAGTYYLVTITFTINKKPDALMTQPMVSCLTSCCRALHRQREYPTDELLIHLVRAQQLSQSIAQAFGRPKAANPPTAASGGEGRRQAPQQQQRHPQASMALTRTMLDRVKTFTSTLPPHIRTNVSLISHVQVAEMFVYENSLEDLFRSSWYAGLSGQPQQQLLATTRPRTSPTLSPMPTPASAPTPGSGGSSNSSVVVGGGGVSSQGGPSDANAAVDAERIAMLWQCLRLVSDFMAARFAFNVEDYPCLTCLSSFHITYVFVMMLKLATLQVPGWDLSRVRAELRCEEVMTRLIDRLELVAERRWRKKARNPSGDGGASGPGPEPGSKDPYSKLVRRARMLRDALCVNGFDSDYSASRIQRFCEPAPMTMADVTQDLKQDLGGGLWLDDADNSVGAFAWDALFSGEAMDWIVDYT